MNSLVALAVAIIPTVLILLIVAYTVGWTKGWDEALAINKKYQNVILSYAKAKLLELSDFKKRSYGTGAPDLTRSFLRLGVDLHQCGINETIVIRSEKIRDRIEQEFSGLPFYDTSKSIAIQTIGTRFIFEKEVKTVVED